MSDREIIKFQIDHLPEAIVSKILEFIQFQKFANGLFDNDTEYLSSMPEVKKSIIEGMNTPISECSRDLE